MYASVRQYRSSNVEEVSRAAAEGFVPVVRAIQGFVAWYLVDSGDGTLTTITISQDEAGAQESVQRAREWTSENIAGLLEGSPTVTNGAVLASA